MTNCDNCRCISLTANSLKFFLMTSYTLSAAVYTILSKNVPFHGILLLIRLVFRHLEFLILWSPQSPAAHSDGRRTCCKEVADGRMDELLLPDNQHDQRQKQQKGIFLLFSSLNSADAKSVDRGEKRRGILRKKCFLGILLEKEQHTHI